MKKITFCKKPGFLSLAENRRGVFVAFEKGVFKVKNRDIKYRHIKLTDVYKTKATVGNPAQLFQKRRKITRWDVEKYGSKVVNYVTISPEIIPDVIQALKFAYKEAQGITDVEVEQELIAKKEEDVVGDLIGKVGLS